MYGTLTSLLIVFLTHPGTLVTIPAPGLYSWLRGLWQATWVLVMQSFSDGKTAFFAEVAYGAIFVMWASVQLGPYMRKV
jgi:hypothetical protein